MYSKYEKKDSSIDFTDCFAYGRYKCNALTEFVCKECGECSFYQPRYIYLERLKKATQRNQEK